MNDLKEKLQKIYDELYEVSIEIDSNQTWQAISRLSATQNKLDNIIDSLE